MTREYVFVCIEVSDGDEVAYPCLQVEFNFTPGQPECGPSYASGGEPAEPAEIEFLSATCIDTDGLTLTQVQIDTLACSWLLTEHGREMALEVAGES